MIEAEMTKAPQYLYKVLSYDLWQKSQGKNALVLSSMDDVFIHFSTEAQLEKTITKFFSSVPKYVVLKIESNKLAGKLIYESNPGGSSKWYHLYNGTISNNAVVECRVVEDQKFTSLEDVYTPKYCQQLEAAYGQGMMSEGGDEAIHHLVEGITMNGKTALDIGSGLGGVAFYVARKYGATVTGLEVNHWMVQEAARRLPEDIKGRVDFVLSTSNSHWPLADKSRDIIYSKGVLTHVEQKDGIFQECHRILRDDGILVIGDFLSSDTRQWGEHIGLLNDLEKLDVYPESERGYVELLTRNGFTVLSIRDDTPMCIGWTNEIINRLQDPAMRQQHLQYFDEQELAAAILGYEAIGKAFEVGEARVLRFAAKKK